MPTVPNGVIKVGRYGKWKLIANMSAFQKAHPVAHPDPEDFEHLVQHDRLRRGAVPDGLQPRRTRPGHPAGRISRVIDIPASQGHVVSTALVHHRATYIASLGVFDPTDAAGDEHVWRLTGGCRKPVPPGRMLR